MRILKRMLSYALALSLIVGQSIPSAFAAVDRDDISEEDNLSNVPYNQTVHSYNNSGLVYSWGGESISQAEFPENPTEVWMSHFNKTQFDSSLQKRVRKVGENFWGTETSLDVDNGEQRYEYDLQYKVKEGAGAVTLADSIEFIEGNPADYNYSINIQPKSPAVLKEGSVYDVNLDSISGGMWYPSFDIVSTLPADVSNITWTLKDTNGNDKWGGVNSGRISANKSKNFRSTSGIWEEGSYTLRVDLRSEVKNFTFVVTSSDRLSVSIESPANLISETSYDVNLDSINTWTPSVKVNSRYPVKLSYTSVLYSTTNSYRSNVSNTVGARSFTSKKHAVVAEEGSYILKVSFPSLGRTFDFSVNVHSTFTVSAAPNSPATLIPGDKYQVDLALVSSGSWTPSFTLNNNFSVSKSISYRFKNSSGAVLWSGTQTVGAKTKKVVTGSKSVSDEGDYILEVDLPSGTQKFNFHVLSAFDPDKVKFWVSAGSCYINSNYANTKPTIVYNGNSATVTLNKDTGNVVFNPRLNFENNNNKGCNITVTANLVSIDPTGNKYYAHWESTESKDFSISASRESSKATLDYIVGKYRIDYTVEIRYNGKSMQTRTYYVTVNGFDYVDIITHKSKEVNYYTDGNKYSYYYTVYSPAKVEYNAEKQAWFNSVESIYDFPYMDYHLILCDIYGKCFSGCEKGIYLDYGDVYIFNGKVMLDCWSDDQSAGINIYGMRTNCSSVIFNNDVVLNAYGSSTSSIYVHTALHCDGYTVFNGNVFCNSFDGCDGYCLWSDRGKLLFNGPVNVNNTNTVQNSLGLGHTVSIFNSSVSISGDTSRRSDSVINNMYTSVTIFNSTVDSSLPYSIRSAARIDKSGFLLFNEKATFPSKGVYLYASAYTKKTDLNCVFNCNSADVSNLHIYEYPGSSGGSVDINIYASQKLYNSVRQYKKRIDASGVSYIQSYIQSHERLTDAQKSGLNTWVNSLNSQTNYIVATNPNEFDQYQIQIRKLSLALQHAVFDDVCNKYGVPFVNPFNSAYSTRSVASVSSPSNGVSVASAFDEDMVLSRIRTRTLNFANDLVNYSDVNIVYDEQDVQSYALEAASNISGWLGRLTSIDTSQIEQTGIIPFVYFVDFKVADWNPLMEAWNAKITPALLTERPADYTGDLYGSFVNNGDTFYYRSPQWYRINTPEGFTLYEGPDSLNASSADKYSIMIHLVKFPEEGEPYNPYFVEQGDIFNVKLQMTAPKAQDSNHLFTKNQFWAYEKTTDWGFVGQDHGTEYNPSSEKSRLVKSNEVTVWQFLDIDTNGVSETLPFVGGIGTKGIYTLALIPISLGAFLIHRKRKSKKQKYT